MRNPEEIASCEAPRDVKGLELAVRIYVSLAGDLSRVIRALTSDYCRDGCQGGLYRCCTANYHERGIPGLMLEMQEAEARRNGYIESQGNPCEYHTLEKGCLLESTRPPLCLGNLCEDAKYSIQKAYGYQATARFIEAMDGLTISGCFFEESYKEAIQHMKRAISEGDRIIRASKGTK